LVLVSLFFYDLYTTVIYTLSLHDALPISAAFVPGLRLRRALADADRRAELRALARARPVPAAGRDRQDRRGPLRPGRGRDDPPRSEEHTSELQSRENLVCRLLLEKKKKHT